MRAGSDHRRHLVALQSATAPIFYKMLAGDPTARMIFFDLASVNSAFGGMLPRALMAYAPAAGARLCRRS